MTRLSLGVQSLDDALLRRLGRTHSAADAAAAYRAARAAGFDDVSVDLLYACPGQDLATWVRTLDEALAWAPGSPLRLRAHARARHPLRPAPARRRCRTRISRWPSSKRWSSAPRERASSGTRSRTSPGRAGAPATTSATGVAQDYSGSAPGAHGALGAIRYWTQRSEPRWRAAVLAGGWGIESWERLSERQVAGERLVLGLRLAEGIPREWLERHLGGPGRGSAGIAATWRRA